MSEARNQDKSTAIEEAAQDWLLRLTSGAATEADWAAFEAWCAADPRHRKAFEEVNELWCAADGLRSAFSAMPDPPDEMTWRPRRAIRRRMILGGVLVASLALLVVATGVPTMSPADYRTAVGEQASVRLPDGSRAHLNTDTAIAVDYAAGRRQVSLLRGEALFEVEKDPSRPFHVLALGGTASAIGTAFVVRVQGERATITVTEGRVRIVSAASAAGAPSEATLAAADEVSFAAGQALGNVRRIDLSHAAVWRRGEIVISGWPLAEVLAEIDRYRPGRILLLAGTSDLEPVTARLSLDALDGGITALAATHGLSVTALTDYLLVVH